MEQINLKAYKRDQIGKEFAKKMRNEGFIPAVVYKGKDSVSLKLIKVELLKLLRGAKSGNIIINLNIFDEIDSKSKTAKSKPDSRTVIIKEIQQEPVKGEVLHVDFNQISLTELLKVKVGIESKGESKGVKQDGGILEHIMWEIEVECLPTQIPEKIGVDVTDLAIGDSIYVKDLKVPEGVKILVDPQLIVLSVKPPAAEEVVAPKPEGEEVVEEPEVIKQKKVEETEEEAAGGQTKQQTKETKEAKETKEEKK